MSLFSKIKHTTVLTRTVALCGEDACVARHCILELSGSTAVVHSLCR